MWRTALALVQWPAIMIILGHTGCTSKDIANSSDRQENLFCSRLVDIVGFAFQYFEPIRGVRYEADLFRARSELPGADRCLVDYTDTKFDAYYECAFGSFSDAERNYMLAKFREVERDVDMCIAQQNPFPPSAGGGDRPRYETSPIDDSYVTWNDRWRNIDVGLTARPSLHGDWELILEVRGR